MSSKEGRKELEDRMEVSAATEEAVENTTESGGVNQEEDNDGDHGANDDCVTGDRLAASREKVQTVEDLISKMIDAAKTLNSIIMIRWHWRPCLDCSG